MEGKERKSDLQKNGMETRIDYTEKNETLSQVGYSKKLLQDEVI